MRILRTGTSSRITTQTRPGRGHSLIQASVVAVCCRKLGRHLGIAVIRTLRIFSAVYEEPPLASVTFNVQASIRTGVGVGVG